MSDQRRANDTLPTLDMSKTLVDHAPANAEPPVDETARHTPLAKAKSDGSTKGKKRASIVPPSPKATSVSKLAAKSPSLPKIPVAAKVEPEKVEPPRAAANEVKSKSAPPPTLK